MPTDGKRPGGLRLVPWRSGRYLLLDATFALEYDLQYVCRSAAEYASKFKHTKYSALEPMYDRVPVAVETTET